MKHFVRHIIILLVVISVAGCRDELMKEEGIGEGRARISATLDFKPMSSALAKTRAAGDALKDIASLHVLLYDYENKKLVDGWKIEGYIPEDKPRTDKDAENGETAEASTKHVTFTLPEEIGFGKYHMYAVANIPDLLSNPDYSKYIQTVDSLKGISLKWNSDPDSITCNAQMMGCFTQVSDRTLDESVTLNQKSVNLHAWLRRAASKVTIAYNGSKLADGVEIYILAASIKDIPVKCPLGLPNEPDTSNLLIPQGGSILYYKNDINAPDPNELTLDGYEARVTKQEPNYGSNHSEAADALFFYENMQGEGKPKAQTAPGPGNNEGKDHAIGFPNPDKDAPGSGWKDDKPFGTYIEVDAYYRSTNVNRPGSGIVKYRFMLGKDTDTNYDAIRNCHYKLTLNFKGYANDYDWHIDYDSDQVFEVTQPKVYNYMGKVFMPDYFWPNGMHNFVSENPITVTSYVGNVDDPKIMFNPVEVEMTFDDSDSCWLECTEQPGLVPYQKNFVFKVKPEALMVDDKYVKKFNIDSLLASASPKGEVDNPINLADLNRQPIGSNAHITCTANCYMVDAPGWYILPLVYGNAIHNGAVIESSYRPDPGSIQEDILPVFKNYKNADISSAYIEKDLKINTVTPFLVWQDVDGLVDYNCWEAPNTQIVYVPNAFYDDKGSKTIGGVKFHVAKGQQGNSVIAVGDNMPSLGKVLSNLPDAYWSWHIWVTCLDKQLDDGDKTIEVQGHDPKRHFKFMPVNLGWCSGEDENIIYYKERRCTVKFTFTGSNGEKKTETREIVKKSHIALTRGYSPYYQWGRKDPFAPALAPMNEGGGCVNKTTWLSVGWDYTANPYPMTTFTDIGGVTHQGKLENRVDTRDALYYLIKYPYAWHNPPRRQGQSGDIYDYVSINKTYVNLWEGRPGVNPDAQILKTVYDPSPVGYQVPHINAFSGFTTTGLDSSIEPEWYDVRFSNIRHYDPEAFGGGPYVYELYEFYTTPDKTQSIIFPINGYRDWDGNGSVFQYGLIGYAWAAGNQTQGDRQFFNFEFAHNDGNTGGRDQSYIRPRNMFYSCDGFPVRPVRNGNHGIDMP